jgi:hypothetical protein
MLQEMRETGRSCFLIYAPNLDPNLSGKDRSYLSLKKDDSEAIREHKTMNIMAKAFKDAINIGLR